MEKAHLLAHLDQIHTTPLGVERIKRNLNLNTSDVVNFCRQKIQQTDSLVTKKGKNWYVSVDNLVLTINTYSYTIITAHSLSK